MKISDIFNFISIFYNHLISIFGRNSQNGQWKMNFFSAQVNFDDNLWSTYVSKVFFVGITILGRRDWAVKKLLKKHLKFKRPLGAVPQAYELNIDYGLGDGNVILDILQLSGQRLRVVPKMTVLPLVPVNPCPMFRHLQLLTYRPRFDACTASGINQQFCAPGYFLPHKTLHAVNLNQFI